MRAVVVCRTEVELIETAVPEPAAGQVRIAVAAAGINPVELAPSAAASSRPASPPSTSSTGSAGTLPAPSTRPDLG